jgi:hypothetical protein
MALTLHGTELDNVDVLVDGKIEVDMFRLTSDSTGSGVVNANLERCDDASFSKIGTGMSQSSGVFTFPRTGVYEVKTQAMMTVGDADGTAIVITGVTTNNGTSFDTVTQAVGGDDQGTNAVEITAYAQCFVNVTDVSNVKVRFSKSSFGSSTSLEGDTDLNKTCFSFIRLGDSQ